jgi:signal peptidase I
MQSKGTLSVIYEVVSYTILALVIVIPFRIFIAQPFIVSGASMLPTINPKEYLVIDVLSHELRPPMRGEVIVFRYPFDSTLYFVKRVIGLPGETVSIANGVVTVTTTTGETLVLDEPYILDANRTHETNVTKLDAGEYFVLGDNRKGSSDSRVWGPLQEKFIVGYAFARLYPFERFAYRPGDHIFPN